MEYYIISNPTPITKEYEIVNYILENFNLTFHLRKPDFKKSQMSEYLSKISNSLHHKIVLHSHHELINHFEIKGVHFTHHNKKNIPDLAHINCSKSISTHSYDEILSYKTYFNYYFLSPIFQSISKPNYGGDSFNKQELKTFIQSNNDKKIVALGGIDKHTIGLAADLGFNGVALLGTLWQYCCSIHNLSNVNNIFESLKIPKEDC
ncbi:thiamine phosphate synthase [Labilibacter marinus]|uniref:thiamine phosphate synthase n=1 Tax=Labilibacter marinus TaxID=1477105 RepID=UPI00094FB35C|nr:thiamine phosphate synthase [Labilibacter marinus]